MGRDYFLTARPRGPLFSFWASTYYKPGQNVLGHLRKLGTKTHFAKLSHILPLKKAWGCCYKGLFLLSPSPLSSVDCVELIKTSIHNVNIAPRGKGGGKMPQFDELFR